ILAAEDGKLSRLVIADLVAEHGKTELQGAIEHVGLRESKHHAPRQVSQVDLHLQRLAASQEVVGGIVQPDEGSLQSADPAIQPDAVLALLVDLQGQVHLTIFLVQLLVGYVRVIRLELVEIGKLIQPQEAQFPQTGVVHAAFFQSQLAPDHLVTRGRVADELDAAHIELLALVDVDLQKSQFLLVVERSVGHRREVDIAILAVGLPQSLQTFGDLVAAKQVSVLEREQGTQRGRVGNRFVVLERDLTQVVLVAFLDGHRNINGLAGSRLQQPNMDALMPGVVDFCLGIVHHDFEVAPVLVLGAHPLGVFSKLGGIVGLGKDILQENGMGNADRSQILHRRAQNPRLDILVAFELDLADFDLRSFLDHECEADRSGRNLPQFCANGGELPPVFGKQVLDGNLCLLEAGGIVLTFDHQAYFVLLEAVEHVAIRNRTEANVVDFANCRLFLHLDNDPPALGGLLTEELDVFEVARVPQGVEVAFQRGGIVNVPGLGEDAGLDGIGGNAAVAADINLRNNIGLRPSQACRCATTPATSA